MESESGCESKAVCQCQCQSVCQPRTNLLPGAPQAVMLNPKKLLISNVFQGDISYFGMCRIPTRIDGDVEKTRAEIHTKYITSVFAHPVLMVVSNTFSVKECVYVLTRLENLSM